MRSFTGTSAGITMMVLSTACFTVNDTLLKLAMADLPPLEALLLRGVGTVALGVPLVAALGYFRFMPRMMDPRVQIRNLLELIAAMGFVVGLAHAPIADLTALGQTSPLLLLIGAVLFLRERLRPLQITLIAAAFVGALMVAQPGLDGFTPYTLFGLWSACAVAARDLVGRGISVTVPGLVIAVGAGMIEIVGAGAAGYFLEEWRMPSLMSVLLAFGSSAFLVAAHWLLLAAYRAASVASIAPFLYMSTIWALVSGWAIFATAPNSLALIGMALILLSGTVVIAIERWTRRAVLSP
jgi:drug/metabolite transporter (DMT)-like permease